MEQTDLFGHTTHTEIRASNKSLKEFEDYDGFVEKFKPKKTTDDCYTPTDVYAAILSWLKTQVDLSGKTICRPFYPGGDFENYPYKPTDVVVDNPPFSIISAIRRFYQQNGIPYFLFAPHLTIFSTRATSDTSIITSSNITYENGANVNTSFVSNLFGDIRIMSAPTLHEAIDSVQKGRNKKKKIKLKYPPELVTSSRIASLALYGVEFKIMGDECFQVRELDAQKLFKKGIYGSGYLVSERIAEEIKAAEQRAKKTKMQNLLEHARPQLKGIEIDNETFVFKLSERERKMIKELR